MTSRLRATRRSESTAAVVVVEGPPVVCPLPEGVTGGTVRLRAVARSAASDWVVSRIFGVSQIVPSTVAPAAANDCRSASTGLRSIPVTAMTITGTWVSWSRTTWARAWSA